MTMQPMISASSRVKSPANISTLNNLRTRIPTTKQTKQTPNSKSTSTNLSLNFDFFINTTYSFSNKQLSQHVWFGGTCQTGLPFQLYILQVGFLPF